MSLYDYFRMQTNFLNLYKDVLWIGLENDNPYIFLDSIYFLKPIFISKLIFNI